MSYLPDIKQSNGQNIPYGYTYPKPNPKNDKNLLITPPGKASKNSIVLNQELAAQKRDTNAKFTTVSKSSSGSCDGYTSYHDARLVNSVRGGNPLVFDKPPRDSGVPLSKLGNPPKYTPYKYNNTSYESVNSGDVTYYVNKDLEDPYFEPNFTRSQVMTPVLYKDPMDSNKPIYERRGLNSSRCIRSPNGHEYFGKLSWIEDTTEHRENILASQMTKMNQSRFNPYFKYIMSEV